MAGSLQGVLASIPGLAGYLASQQQREQGESRDLSQLGALAQLQARMAEQQKTARTERQQLQYRADLQAAGGDPVKVREVAERYASPDALVKMRTEGGFTLGDTRYDPSGRVIVTNPKDDRAETEPLLRLQVARERMAQTLPPDHPMLKQIDERIGILTSRPERAEAVSPLGRLIGERDALPAGHPNRAIYDKAINDFKTGNSTNVTVSPTLQLGKEGSNKVDTGLLDTTKGVMSLSAIEGQFKPEFQQWIPRMSAGWSAVKDSLGVNLNPQDKKTLADFSSYKRNAINTMNEYIKSITGAAMSEAEAQRILRGMPNPGQGLFDGDSPTEFKAKLDDAMRQTKMALARYTYIKRSGIALSDANGNAVVPLERMPQLMNERGKALEAEIKRTFPTIPDDQLKARVRQFLAKEFGLVQ